MNTSITKIELLPPHSGMLLDSADILNGASIPNNIIILMGVDYEDNQEVFILSHDLQANKHLFQNLVSILKGNGIQIKEILLISTDVFNILTNQSDILTSQKKTSVIFKIQEQLDLFINEAIKNHASDLHFQLNSNSACLFHRIDGQLIHIRDLDPLALSTFLEASYLSFSVNREHEAYQVQAPQFSAYEGIYFLESPYIKSSLGFKPHDVTVRLRKQRCPLDKDTLDEVWRILIIDHESSLPTLEDLGYEPIQIALMERAVHRPEGLILVTGTTGSGKTITLSVLLHLSSILNKGKHCIRTIENPKELVLNFARQRNIENPNQFAQSIEIYLRMDPDEMMVGEIRDSETARAVTHGVLSGHPLYGTLHTSDVATTIARLEGLGIDNVTMGEKNFLNIICNQSLIRLLCSKCKVPYLDSQESKSSFLTAELELTKIDANKIFGPSDNGCDYCKGSGFFGRTVIAEVVEITQTMKRQFYLGNIYEAFDHWITLDPCKKHANPKSKLDHALLRLERGEVSPKSVIDSCGVLFEEAHNV